MIDVIQNPDHSKVLFAQIKNNCDLLKQKLTNHKLIIGPLRIVSIRKAVTEHPDKFEIQILAEIQADTRLLIEQIVEYKGIARTRKNYYEEELELLYLVEQTLIEMIEIVEQNVQAEVKFTENLQARAQQLVNQKKLESKDLNADTLAAEITVDPNQVAEDLMDAIFRSSGSDSTQSAQTIEQSIHPQTLGRIMREVAEFYLNYQAAPKLVEYLSGLWKIRMEVVGCWNHCTFMKRGYDVSVYDTKILAAAIYIGGIAIKTPYVRGAGISYSEKIGKIISNGKKKQASIRIINRAHEIYSEEIAKIIDSSNNIDFQQLVVGGDDKERKSLTSDDLEQLYKNVVVRFCGEFGFVK